VISLAFAGATGIGSNVAVSISVACDYRYSCRYCTAEHARGASSVTVHTFGSLSFAYQFFDFFIHGTPPVVCLWYYVRLAD